MKFGNRFTLVDNIKFHSKKEADYYLYLKQLLRSGLITDLELQPVYQIIINGINICKVILDFRFYDKQLNKTVIIDTKGFDTAMSKLKRKLVNAAYGIEVQIV